jgi:glutamate 5-kinase
MDADLLINLTDIDGLYTKDPRRYEDAELIPVVSRIEKRIEKFAGDIPGALGTGGMLSKIKAARKLSAVGIPMVIANGTKTNILPDLLNGQRHGTFFVPTKKKLPSRKGWIAFNLKPQGTLVIDDGAVNALLKNGKSLLPSGITDVDGDFSVGSAVVFRSQANRVIGIGLVNYSSVEIRKIKGQKSGQIKKCLGHKAFDEVIHRDNLTITVEIND